MKSKLVVLIVALVFTLCSALWAGNPESTAPPGSAFSLNLEDLFLRLTAGTVGTPRVFTEPSLPPGTGTMHTIDEIMAVAPAPDNANGARADEVAFGKTFWGLRTDGTWGLQTGTLNECPEDPDKFVPGICGCGVSDADSDGDGTVDCNDQCPNDPAKTAPGICGCGVAEEDSDADGVVDCIDSCLLPGEDWLGSIGTLCRFHGNCYVVTRIQDDDGDGCWVVFIADDASGCDGSEPLCNQNHP